MSEVSGKDMVIRSWGLKYCYYYHHACLATNGTWWGSGEMVRPLGRMKFRRKSFSSCCDILVWTSTNPSSTASSIITCILSRLCFQMWCGPTSCKLGAKGRACPSDQSCIPIREGHCFVKPCPDAGECWSSNPPPPSTKCHPSSSYQDNSCANITFTFNKEILPPVSYLGTREGGDQGCFSCLSSITTPNELNQLIVKDQVFPSWAKRVLVPDLLNN